MSTLTVKVANRIDQATSKDILFAGEIWIDPATNKAKIGDGKTPLFELPWIYLSADLSTEPPRKYKMNDEVKNFIEKYIDLIEEHRFDEVYAMINHSSIEFTRDFTRALLEADLNPKPYLTRVPRCIQDLLLDAVDNVNNKIYNYDCDVYTKTELSAKFDVIRQQIATACGIPSDFLNVGGN